jgi:hypothetical protein|tara:strand:- start:26 stop:478 length:453 start_codon:yes stop_codon:yes gene_type:complete
MNKATYDQTGVKVIKLDNGDDIVCSFPTDQLQDSTGLIRLIKPLLIKYVPQLTPQGFKDYVALIKWAAYTNDEIITIPIKKIMTITNASSEMEKTFKVMSGDYQKLEAPRKDNDYKRTMFSKQDNAKVNEILDDFNDHPDIPDDDTGTIH